MNSYLSPKEVAIFGSLFLYFQLGIKEAQVESGQELIRELETKMLRVLEVKRKMTEKLCEALELEANPDWEWEWEWNWL